MASNERYIDGRDCPRTFLPADTDMADLVDITDAGGSGFRRFLNTRTGETIDCGAVFRRSIAETDGATAPELPWTPGPWSTGACYPFGAHGEDKPITAAGNVIARVFHNGDENVVIRNAAVMAAGPDLVDALAGCHDMLREAAKQARARGDRGHATMADRHADAAHEALAKAGHPGHAKR